MTSTALPIVAAASTDAGRLRPHNEDAFLIDANLGLYLVADGVGGHGGGSEASRSAVENLPRLFSSALVSAVASKRVAAQQKRAAGNKGHIKVELSDPELQALLDDAIDALNTLVYIAGEPMAVTGRMGTTITGGLYLDSGNALIFNVGDSRTYRYREGKLTRVTTDQSWYQTWLDGGSVGPAPPRNVILQGIGLDDHVTPDWIVTDCQRNDIWLSCSDGLTDLVSDGVIHRELHIRFGNTADNAITEESLKDLCNELTALANAAGGDDNITVLALSPKDKPE